MTRVLMTADTVGGVWTYAVELADALRPHGMEVHLATMGRPMSPDQRAAVAQSAVVDVVEGDFALEWQDGPWSDVEQAGEWLLELEGELRPDLVHLNGYVHAALPWWSPTVVVAHSDVVSWWRAVHGVDPPPAWDHYRERVTAGLAAATAVVAPTAAVRDDVQTGFGYSDTVVIPNGRRADWVLPRVAEPFVLGTGRVWDEAKGLGLLHAVTPPAGWSVRIAGEGGSLGRRTFPELADLLSRAGIFAAPAAYEPFGLGILEAALAGCPLVLGDVPSLRELWEGAAVFVAPGDGAALTHVLAALAADDGRRAQLSAAARTRAATRTPEAMADGYAALYCRLPAATGVTP